MPHNAIQIAGAADFVALNVIETCSPPVATWSGSTASRYPPDEAAAEWVPWIRATS